MYQFPLQKIKPDLQTRGQKKGLFLGRDPSKQLNGQKNVLFSGRGALAPKKGGAEAMESLTLWDFVAALEGFAHYVRTSLDARRGALAS